MAAAAAGGVLIGADILARHGDHATPAATHDARADAPGDQDGQRGEAGSAAHAGPDGGHEHDTGDHGTGDHTMDGQAGPGDDGSGDAGGHHAGHGDAYGQHDAAPATPLSEPAGSAGPGGDSDGGDHHGTDTHGSSAPDFAGFHGGDSGGGPIDSGAGSPGGW
ncbi:hypothetical protein [Prosthecodimorpha staleyi]|uniref:Uncharacterized protein n=1 Tax=Prosthecodimorpha staleyi TaxID=2840188 RepID=A0A947D288_9HYPH|nr:hypothetical protein [Prosthecodimorpha staleyi]MBT9289366.1 hypothetical protein [Prosthecodimorpha staleyi]